MTMQTKSQTCHTCEGKGYLQLLLGGSETCPNCGGEGNQEE